MKKFFLSLALSTTALIIFPENYVRASGEPGNPVNDCSQPYGECVTSPSKVSITLYRVSLCMSSPMEDPATEPDWNGAGCVDVYNNLSGESTGNILDENGVSLSAQYINDPTNNGYYFIAAIIDKSYKIGTHHMVYDPSTSQPISNIRYISTSSGGVSTGTAEQASMFETSTDSFYYGFDCSNSGYNQANNQSKTGYWGNDVELILLDSDYKLANTLAIDSQGKGKAASGQRICGNVKYIMSITNNFTLINDSSSGIHIRMKVPKGSILLNHETTGSDYSLDPNNANGVIDEIYTGNTFSITFDVDTL